MIQTNDRNDTSPRFRAFVAAYRDHFRLDPSYSAVASYDAMTLLLAGLEKAPVPLREAIGGLGEARMLQQTAKVDRFGDFRSGSSTIAASWSPTRPCREMSAC